MTQIIFGNVVKLDKIMKTCPLMASCYPHTQVRERVHSALQMLLLLARVVIFDTITMLKLYVLYFDLNPRGFLFPSRLWAINQIKASE